MDFFKRKDEQIDDEVTDDAPNPIGLDEKDNKNIQNAQKLNAEEQDSVPSVNSAGRDTNSNKKLKTLGILIGAIVIFIVGIVMASGRYTKNKEAKKAQEAQEAVQAQKTISKATVNVTEDQKQIENNKMYDLPPPTQVDDTAVLNPTPAEPIEPVVQPYTSPQPTYNTYSEPMPVYMPPPEPIIMQEHIQSIMPVAPQQPPAPIVAGSGSDVLVDIHSTKQTTPAQQTTLTGSSNLANGTVSNRGDTTMMLLKGTIIPCILKTKIDSTYQGFSICQVAKDIYSSNGKTLLIERGSNVFGEQNVELTQGQARVAVLWDRIETPKNISINLNSPATGQLGEMGINAKVDNHFLERFGGAIMLSVVQDGFAVARSHLEKTNKNSNGTTVNNTTNTAENMSTEVLKNTINIPPTATVNQGTLINIMVAYDVDFSGVYELQKR